MTVPFRLECIYQKRIERFKRGLPRELETIHRWYAQIDIAGDSAVLAISDKAATALIFAGVKIGDAQ